MSEGRVLIVAEQADAMLLLRLACREAGFAVLCAPDTLHGAAMALRDRPDFVVLDAAIGHDEVLSLCELLRRDPRTSRIQAVMLIDTVEPFCVQRCRTLRICPVLKRSDYSRTAAQMLGVLAKRRFATGAADPTRPQPRGGQHRALRGARRVRVAARAERGGLHALARTHPG